MEIDQTTIESRHLTMQHFTHDIKPLWHFYCLRFFLHSEQLSLNQANEYYSFANSFRRIHNYIDNFVLVWIVLVTVIAINNCFDWDGTMVIRYMRTQMQFYLVLLTWFIHFCHVMDFSRWHSSETTVHQSIAKSVWLLLLVRKSNPSVFFPFITTNWTWKERSIWNNF